MKWSQYVRLIKYCFLIKCQKILHEFNLKKFIEGVYECKGLHEGKLAVRTIAITLESEYTDTYKVVQSVRYADADEQVELTNTFYGVYKELNVFMIDDIVRIPCFFMPERKMMVMNNVVFKKIEQ